MTFDLIADYGSHLGMLDAALAKLPPGSLVIEHGAGVYSSPAIARHDVSVLLVEGLPGWASWGRWFYESAGRSVSVVDRNKHAVRCFDQASLLFIDGEARERGPLLQWALEHKVPLIIAHDTEEAEWRDYDHKPHYFTWKGYDITHDTGHRHRTTQWRLRA